MVSKISWFFSGNIIQYAPTSIEEEVFFFDCFTKKRQFQELLSRVILFRQHIHQADGASAPETVDSGSIPGLVKD